MSLNILEMYLGLCKTSIIEAFAKKIRGLCTVKFARDICGGLQHVQRISFQRDRLNSKNEKNQKEKSELISE